MVEGVAEEEEAEAVQHGPVAAGRKAHSLQLLRPAPRQRPKEPSPAILLVQLLTVPDFPDEEEG